MKDYNKLLARPLNTMIELPIYLLPNPRTAPIIMRAIINWGEANELSTEYNFGPNVWPTIRFIEIFIKAFIVNQALPKGLYQEGNGIHLHRIYSNEEFVMRGEQYTNCIIDIFKFSNNEVSIVY